jgi:CRP/FNR family transcriptional regulator
MKQVEDPLSHLRISTILSFEQGQTIYSAGDEATNLFLVISGSVKISRRTNSSREIAVCICQVDDVFGESAMIDSCRSETTIALEPTRVMVWSKAKIEAGGMENPRLFYALLQTMIARVGFLAGRIESYAVDSAKCRLARALIELAAATPGNPNGGPARIKPLTHEILSSYIGSTREVVTLLMNQFRRSGCLTYSREGISLMPQRMREKYLEIANCDGAEHPLSGSEE